jgi:predicted ATPase
MPVESRGFFGRETELATLERLYDEASCGSTRAALITGDPGIGKTRLVTELCARVAGETSNHWVRCYAGQPPFWCWTQLLRQLDVADSVAAGLKRSEAEHDPASHFDALLAMVEAIAAASKVTSHILVLDDIHLADEASLAAQAFVGRELRTSQVLLLATYRDVEVRRGHPLARALGELTREDVVERIRLTGLSVDQVGTLLDATAGMKADEVAAALHQRTGGNPLFVSEFGKLAATGGRYDALRLPEGIVDVIGLRLDLLDDGAIDLMRAAAVIGERFPRSRLQAMAT